MSYEKLKGCLIMIKNLEIKNAKSLKFLKLEFEEITALLGSNGTGKTNIINILKYFYESLDSNEVKKINDEINPFIQYSEIKLTFDISTVNSKIEKILKNESVDQYKKNYFNKIKLTFEKYCDDQKYLEIIMEQSKEGIKKFNIEDIKVRRIIKDIFPLYIIKTREINLIDWKEIWGIISDLGRIQSKDEKKLKDGVQKIFPKVSKSSSLSYLDIIKTVIKENDLDIKSSKRSPGLYQFLIGGEEFLYNAHNLKHFSDGLNSFNFIKLFLLLVSKIPSYKVKYPIVLLDEPEIGLHPKYIDEITDVFLVVNKYITIVVATHSSRMLKNILSMANKKNLYHLRLCNNYTYCTKMNYLMDIRERNFISELEASYYFSEAIAFVEGVSEQELYNYHLIIKIFPELKRISFFSFDSNNQRLKIIHPKNKNISIPYLTIVDSDKIYSYDTSNKKFIFSNKNVILNPFADKDTHKKELTLFGNKRYKTLKARATIDKIINSTKFYFNDYWGTLKGNNILYEKLKTLINAYCLEYSVFPVKTTVEGCLINSNTLDIYIEWLKQENPRHITEITNSFNQYTDVQIKLTIARLIQDGKYDNLLTRNQIDKYWKKNNITKITSIEDTYELIDKLKGSKTQWITSFLDFYFGENMYLTEEEIKDKFISDFPELYRVIIQLHKLVE